MPFFKDTDLEHFIVHRYMVLDHCLDESRISSLKKSLVQKLNQDQLKNASIGRGAGQQTESLVRNDKIHWLDRTQPEDQQWFDFSDRLKTDLNQSLYLGLTDEEFHLAYYPENGFYDTHIDQSSEFGFTQRVVSVVLYMNDNWQSGDGGELQLFSPQDHQMPQRKIEPLWNRLVLFDSAALPHRVNVNNKGRFSLTGWFKKTKVGP